MQCSGHSFALAACCPSEAAFGFERNLALTKNIIEAVSVPVMADGEDGFGDPPVVGQTVRAFIRAGVAGINIEDQLLGQPGPKRVIDRGRMTEKINAAREVARLEGCPDLVINGRTDALMAAADRNNGLNESITRANLYLDAGRRPGVCHGCCHDRGGQGIGARRSRPREHRGRSALQHQQHVGGRPESVWRCASEPSHGSPSRPRFRPSVTRWPLCGIRRTSHGFFTRSCCPCRRTLLRLLGR